MRGICPSRQISRASASLFAGGNSVEFLIDLDLVGRLDRYVLIIRDQESNWGDG